MKKVFTVLCVTALLVGLAPASEAIPLTWKLTGEVNVVSDPFTHLFSSGDPVEFIFTFETSTPDLSIFVAIVVTVYDASGRVIAVGWRYETDPAYLVADKRELELFVEPLNFVYDLDLEMDGIEVQVFGE